ncbi:MAG: hypothetical protein HQ481_12615 [Alphaproteobacteria bacterium]|nr:hypothetical protein [Alphaproteobacteria bacterium]
MSRVALESALKKPGRVLTWHAGGGCRSHKTSNREDYYTVLPKELAAFVHTFGSDTTEPEILEIFLEEMLIDLVRLEENIDALAADDPLIPTVKQGEEAILFEIRGYFQGCLEFYVTQKVMPPTDPFRPGPQPRWLVLASPHIRAPGRCAAAFDDLLDRCENVARRHDLILDMRTVRDGFRSMLRRRGGYPSSASPSMEPAARR